MRKDNIKPGMITDAGKDTYDSTCIQKKVIIKTVKVIEDYLSSLSVWQLKFMNKL